MTKIPKPVQDFFLTLNIAILNAVHMKNLVCFFAIFSLFLLARCGTPNATSNRTDLSNANDIENPDQSISLVDHLRRVPGVQVNGEGLNATIRIRGASSLYSSTEPLFVLNGQPMAGGLREAIQMIPVQEIKTINVLKNASETGIYGVRGANGIIEITLKSGTDRGVNFN